MQDMLVNYMLTIVWKWNGLWTYNNLTKAEWLTVDGLGGNRPILWLLTLFCVKRFKKKDQTSQILSEECVTEMGTLLFDLHLLYVHRFQAEYWQVRTIFFCQHIWKGGIWLSFGAITPGRNSCSFCWQGRSSQNL